MLCAKEWLRFPRIPSILFWSTVSEFRFHFFIKKLQSFLYTINSRSSLRNPNIVLFVMQLSVVKIMGYVLNALGSRQMPYVRFGSH